MRQLCALVPVVLGSHESLGKAFPGYLAQRLGFRHLLQDILVGVEGKAHYF